MTTLTPPQERFCREYLKDLNATRAYQRAYPNATWETAHVNGPNMIAKARVSERIAELQKERERRTQVSADRVVLELARLAFVDVRNLFDVDGNLKPAHLLDDATAAAVAGIDVEEVYKAVRSNEELDPQPQGGAMKRTRGAELIGRVKKVRLLDKTKALHLLMRHLGMLADRVTGQNAGAALPDVSRIPADDRTRLLSVLRSLYPDRPIPVVGTE